MPCDSYYAMITQAAWMAGDRCIVFQAPMLYLRRSRQPMMVATLSRLKFHEQCCVASVALPRVTAVLPAAVALHGRRISAAFRCTAVAPSIWATRRKIRGENGGGEEGRKRMLNGERGHACRLSDTTPPNDTYAYPYTSVQGLQLAVLLFNCSSDSEGSWSP
eukprot:9496837-Pyramimonas_sp.AAC.1